MEFYSIRGKIGQSFGRSHCSSVGGGASCNFACCFDVLYVCVCTCSVDLSSRCVGFAPTLACSMQ
jgi:hypothetical protein